MLIPRPEIELLVEAVLKHTAEAVQRFLEQSGAFRPPEIFPDCQRIGRVVPARRATD